MRVCVRVFSVGFGPRVDSMSPARSRRSASHAAGTHGWLPKKTGRPGLRRGGVGGYNLHSVPPTDLLQRGRAAMSCQRSKSQDVSSIVGRSGEVWTFYIEERLNFVVLKRQGGRVKVRGCCVLLVEDIGKAIIRELLVLVCLLLKDGLTVLSMWSESLSGSFI